MTIDAEYVLPLRWADDSGLDELVAYLTGLRESVEVTVVDGSAPERQVTTGPGERFGRFSPDGTRVSWTQNPGKDESFARIAIAAWDEKTGTVGAAKPLTAAWDRSVTRLRASGDGRKLLATADDVGQVSLFSIDVANGTPHRIVGPGHVSDFNSGKGSVVIAWENLGAPVDLFSVPRGNNPPLRLTRMNEELLGRLRLLRLLPVLAHGDPPGMR